MLAALPMGMASSKTLVRVGQDSTVNKCVHKLASSPCVFSLAGVHKAFCRTCLGIFCQMLFRWETWFQYLFSFFWKDIQFSLGLGVEYLTYIRLFHFFIQTEMACIKLVQKICQTAFLCCLLSDRNCSIPKPHVLPWTGFSESPPHLEYAMVCAVQGPKEPYDWWPGATVRLTGRVEGKQVISSHKTMLYEFTWSQWADHFHRQEWHFPTSGAAKLSAAIPWLKALSKDALELSGPWDGDN